MATGRSNQLIKQLGEYLVACELARRGFVVATFSGNIPDFDLIATDFKGVSYPIQVKTVRGGGWQFSLTKFADISFDGRKQIIGDKKAFRSRNCYACLFALVRNMVRSVLCPRMVESAGHCHHQPQALARRSRWSETQETRFAALCHR